MREEREEREKRVRLREIEEKRNADAIAADVLPTPPLFPGMSAWNSAMIYHSRC
jgi:hypothetical protein